MGPHIAKGFCSGHYQQLRNGRTLVPLAGVLPKEKKSCTFVGCSNVVKTQGLCGGHDAQKRAGKVLHPLKSRHKGQTCSFEGCERGTSHRDLCSPHYKQWWRGEELRPLREKVPRHLLPEKCTFGECEKPYYVHGLCVGHSDQHRRGKELRPLKNKMSRFHAPKLCSLEGCKESHAARGYCSSHYSIMKKYNITPEEWVSLLSEQDRKCAICCTNDPGVRGWQIDHDHSCCPGIGSCGKCIRKLLCMQCNLGIGHFKDNPETLTAAAKYLESHGKVSGTATVNS